MKWSRHQPHAVMHKPAMITINYHGNVLLNAKALKQVVGDAKFFEIFFNDKEGVLKNVGFRFMSKPTSHSLQINFKVAAKTKKITQAQLRLSPAVAKEIAIAHKTAMKFILEYDVEGEMWCINIKKGILLDTTTYSIGHSRKK